MSPETALALALALALNSWYSERDAAKRRFANEPAIFAVRGVTAFFDIVAIGYFC